MKDRCGWHHPFSGHEPGQTSGKAGVLQCIGPQSWPRSWQLNNKFVLKNLQGWDKGSRYAHNKFLPPLFLSIHNLQSLFGLVIL